MSQSTKRSAPKTHPRVVVGEDTLEVVHAVEIDEAGRPTSVGAELVYPKARVKLTNTGTYLETQFDTWESDPLPPDERIWAGVAGADPELRRIVLVVRPVTHTEPA